MKASEFLATLPERPERKREELILDAVRQGLTMPIEWAEVYSYAKGHEAVLKVSTDAVAIGEPDDWVRVTVSHTTAQQIADILGAFLPTSRISDLINDQAAVRLKPCLQRPDKQMAYTSRMVKHHKAVEERRDGRAGLVSSVGKDWVLTNRLAGRPKNAANYGWHDRSSPNKRVWQPVGLAHDRFHVDYSQVVRLVCRTVCVDGQELPLDDVLRSPELAPLVSSEGPLKIVRHPGVPEFDPQGALVPPSEEPTRDGTLPFIPFYGARSYTRTSGRAVDLIVLHGMDVPEKPSTAEIVARWYGGPSAPQASAHYCVDRDSIVQCVHEEDVAWHAPGANHNGVGINHAGYTDQSAAAWADPSSTAMLDLSARLAADICRRHDIPAEIVDEEGLQAGARGITTHAAVARAFRRSRHADPGASFPLEEYVAAVRSYL